MVCDAFQNDSSDDTLSPSSPQRSRSVSEPRKKCPRTMKLEYYERDETTLEEKWRHMDWLDANYDSREERILSTILAKEDTVMEFNPFPYVTPPGVSHMTLWCIADMDTAAIEDFVSSWIAANMPEAMQWNFDENLQRSIDLFHVHVYIQNPVRNEPSNSKRRRCADIEDDVAQVSKRTKVEDYSCDYLLAV